MPHKHRPGQGPSWLAIQGKQDKGAAGGLGQAVLQQHTFGYANLHSTTFPAESAASSTIQHRL